MVLLKNDGILPLDRSKIKRIAVIGPNGESDSMLEGNYHGSASHPISILDGIKQLAGPNIEVTFAHGQPGHHQQGDRRLEPPGQRHHPAHSPNLRRKRSSNAANADIDHLCRRHHSGAGRRRL